MHRKADFYDVCKDLVTCHICPQNCQLKPGQLSRCFSRKNIDGDMVLQNYQKVLIMNTETIEKKTLLHFYPGTQILSIGANGCNLDCKFCVNFHHSKEYKDPLTINNYTSEELLNIAKEQSSIGIAYTYTEPTVWFEFVIDTAKLFKNNTKKNVYISNGYINEEPLNILLNYIDAFSITIKAYNTDIYKNATTGTLEPVLQNIKKIALSGRHLELVYLLVTELNDDESGFSDVVDYIANINDEIPFHILRYYPHYKYDKPMTTNEEMRKFYLIAKKKLKNVYTLGFGIGLHGE